MFFAIVFFFIIIIIIIIIDTDVKQEIWTVFGILCTGKYKGRYLHLLCLQWW